MVNNFEKVRNFNINDFSRFLASADWCLFCEANCNNYKDCSNHIKEWLENDYDLCYAYGSEDKPS